jgi:hypothetical protein
MIGIFHQENIVFSIGPIVKEISDPISESISTDCAAGQHPTPRDIFTGVFFLDMACEATIIIATKRDALALPKLDSQGL